jgi:hypothetical protein
MNRHHPTHIREGGIALPGDGSQNQIHGCRSPWAESRETHPRARSSDQNSSTSNSFCFCATLLRSSSCCARSVSVLDTVRGMTFIAESQAATNPFSFSCAIGLSESSCSATCSLALIDSSAALRQRETFDETWSAAIRIVGLVGLGVAGESVPVVACKG